MLRSIPFSLGPLLVFAAWLTFGPGSAAAATNQKTRRSSSAQRVSSPVIKHVPVAKRVGTLKKTSTITKAKAPEPAQEKEAAAQNGSAPVATASAVRGPNRIDFTERLIQGQSNKSGAVYLYDRKELKTPSMIKKRESFREETLATIYGN
jgi:hypothetical protein